MDNNTFEEPVTVLRGLGFPRPVRTVAEAHALLAEWPHSQRGPAHEMALKACRAALGGLVDAQTARGAFAAFARGNGILMPDNEAVVAARSRAAPAQRPHR